jgi:MSHA pilin protein MshD
MGTGQMMITIAAMMLLSTILLRINATFLSTSTTLYETKYDVLAVSLGTSIIENATSKAFDEATVINPVSSVTELSSILRAETGEVYPNFDDVDDFNNYYMTTANDTTFLSAVFNVVCKVNYVNANNPQQISSSRTWHKRIDVQVTSPSMQDTIRLSSVVSYWYFR